mmetsp:Transcript_76072/g.111404  ORF Transcript_76072/g.111404 Transcript_76072/m.111404 type:complete len:247 (+) Transcript_76072:20-760(+)
MDIRDSCHPVIALEHLLGGGGPRFRSFVSKASCIRQRMPRAWWIAAMLSVASCALLLQTSKSRSSVRVELASKDVKTKRSVQGPSHETPGAVGRGRKHGATKVVYADSQAHTLKEKAEHEDKQSRSLRMQANKDYDEAHELMRKSAIITHGMARSSKGETKLRALIQEDKAAIVSDGRSLLRVGMLKKRNRKNEDTREQRSQGRAGCQKRASKGPLQIGAGLRQAESADKQRRQIVTGGQHFCKRG